MKESGKEVNGDSTLSFKLSQKEKVAIPPGTMEDFYGESKDMGGCLGRCMRRCDAKCAEGHTGDACKRACGEGCAKSCEVREAGPTAADMTQEDVGSSDESLGADIESAKDIIEAKDRP